MSPADTHIMVEFFAIGHSSKKIMNTTEAYYKMTEKGQDFHYTSYHILKVDMKGTHSLFLYLCACLKVYCTFLCTANIISSFCDVDSFGLFLA